MTELTRRELLSGISLLGFGAGLHGQAAMAGAHADWVPGDDNTQWRNMIRMQMSTQPGDVPWWYTGRIYAQVGNEQPVHLFNLEGTEIYWVRPLADDSFSISARTLTFFRDRDTGEMLREYRNPFTDQVVPVDANRLGGKDGAVYSAQGWRYVDMMPADQPPKPFQIEWYRSGDTVWMTSSRFSDILPQPWLEAMTVFAPLDDFLDANVPSLRTQFTSTYLSPWMRWLDMGDRAGHLVWHSSGRKLASADEIPAEYRQRADAEYGGLLTAAPDSWD